jgi:Uma2 family endonuclease
MDGGICAWRRLPQGLVYSSTRFLTKKADVGCFSKEIREVSSPTPRHQAVVFNELLALRQYLSGRQGPALADVEFALSDLLRLRPDVCVLLAERALQLDPDRVPVPGAPDLAIEVISPTERASESHEKVRAYLKNGTTEVWQIFPKSRTLEIHQSPVSTLRPRPFSNSEA